MIQLTTDIDWQRRRKKWRGVIDDPALRYRTKWHGSRCDCHKEIAAKLDSMGSMEGRNE